ncbi:MAG: FAD-dependent oxidoreductase [Bacteroidales bacterium]|jgi:ferredoxin--NADP+ reductase|nr:FAD-dependent oxidoreductase [Bacteroidales bacterium]
MSENGLKYDLDFYPVKVESNTEITEGVFVLSYPRSHAFVAGQVVGICLVEGEKPRLYSIASGNQDDMIRLLYNIKPGGEISPGLAELKRGDTLFVSAPFGSFYGTSAPAVFIASGTGIAPFASMLRSGLHQDKMLIHGGRTLDSFYFREEMESVLGNDNYVRCCSQEKGEGVYEGRLTAYLREQEDLPAGRKYYLCGLAEMVVESRDILIEKGIPFENIVAEIYF